MTPGKRLHPLPIVLAVALVALTAFLLYRGWSFYALSLEARVEHPEYRKLRPIGVWGNGYGWIAAVLVVFNLSYLVRRRIGGARLGSMRIWLDIHVFTGLFAATLATFHSAFQLRNPLALISAGSLGIVVVTGLVGRFLYALAPANDRAQLRDAVDAVDAIWPGHHDALVGAIEAHPSLVVPANASLLRCVLAIPKWRRIGRARKEAIARIVPAGDRTLRKTTRRLAAAAAAEAGSSGKSALLRSWRGLHRFFALSMLAAVLLHGGVAWYFGYRWIFE